MNKKKIINDALYGFIHIQHDVLFDCIEQPEFQRLRRNQAAWSESSGVPGSSTHEVSARLGAMHLMTKAIESLRGKDIAITKDEELGALLAILCNDVGHGPFSHSLEHSLLQNVSHELVSLAIMKRLRSELGSVMDTALRIFQGEHPKRYLHQLVSSQLDMDRLDYLRRDSFYTGVSEGTIGLERIIQMLNVNDGELVIDQKGVYSIEKFVMARRFMYWQVYLHKTSMAADQVLLSILRRARHLSSLGTPLFASPALSFFLNAEITEDQLLNESETLDSFLALDDNDIVSAIKVWQDHDDPILAQLSHMLINRRLPKVRLTEHDITPSEYADIEQTVMTRMNIDREDCTYFIYAGKLENTTYTTDEEGIRILYKDGSLKELSQQLKPMVYQAMTALQSSISFATLNDYLWPEIPVKYSVEQIAQIVNGKVLGDKNVMIDNVAKIEEANSASLCFLSNKKYLHYLNETEAAAVIVGKDLEVQPNGLTLIQTDQPYVAFTRVLITLFSYEPDYSGIHPSAVIEDSASIAENVYIGPHVYIGQNVKIGSGSRIFANTSIYENSRIGENSLIYSNVSVYYKSEIGNNVIIPSGTAVGSDGFGHAPMPDGKYLKIPQIGNVIIEDNVEIGSNCSIDRASMGSTIIREGCRIDNLIQIAHGVEVGKHTVIAAQAGISGSTKVGDNCVIAGQVGIVGHITIADKVQIGAQSGVSNSIKEEGGKFTDSPHLPLSQAIRSRILYKKLPEIEKRISELERNKGEE